MAAYLALAFTSLLWGSSFLLTKIASRLFDPFGFAFSRVAIAATALVVVARFSGGLSPGRGAIWGKLATLSLVGQVAPFLMFGKAAQLATSADIALMMGAVPILVFLIGQIVNAGDRWSQRAALGLAVGFAGVALAFWGPSEAGPVASAPNPAAGRAFALAAAVFYAFGSLISAQATRAIGAMRAVAGSMTISTVALGLLWLAFGARPGPDSLRNAPLEPIAAMLALGLVNTALAFVVYFRLIAIAGPTFASLNNFVVPVLGVIAGAAALGEPVASSAWGGLALVLAGVAMTGGSMRARPLAPAK